jgi:hypothetical protein
LATAGGWTKFCMVAGITLTLLGLAGLLLMDAT